MWLTRATFQMAMPSLRSDFFAERSPSTVDAERARNSLAQKQTLRADLKLIIRELERQRGECVGKVTPGFPS